MAEQAAQMSGILGWLVGATLAAVFGIVLGGVIVLGLSGVAKLRNA